MADTADASIPVLIAGGAVALTTGAGVMTAATRAERECKDEVNSLEAGTEAIWSRETNVGARFRRDVGLTREIRRWKIERAKIKYMPPQVRTSAAQAFLNVLCTGETMQAISSAYRYRQSHAPPFDTDPPPRAAARAHS
jgi:hypothetical protein